MHWIAHLLGQWTLPTVSKPLVGGSTPPPPPPPYHHHLGEPVVDGDGVVELVRGVEVQQHEVHLPGRLAGEERQRGHAGDSLGHAADYFCKQLFYLLESVRPKAAYIYIFIPEDNTARVPDCPPCPPWSWRSWRAWAQYCAALVGCVVPPPPGENLLL